jgi:hypothetical protein
MEVQCPERKPAHIGKNGKQGGKQNHIWVDCSHQFIDHYTPYRGYSNADDPEFAPLSRHRLRHALRLLLHYLRFREVPIPPIPPYIRNFNGRK